MYTVILSCCALSILPTNTLLPATKDFGEFIHGKGQDAMLPASRRSVGARQRRAEGGAVGSAARSLLGRRTGENLYGTTQEQASCLRPKYWLVFVKQVIAEEYLGSTK